MIKPDERQPVRRDMVRQRFSSWCWSWSLPSNRPTCRR